MEQRILNLYAELNAGGLITFILNLTIITVLRLRM